MGLVSDILENENLFIGRAVPITKDELEKEYPGPDQVDNDTLPTKQELDEHIEGNIHRENQKWLDRRQKQAESGDIKCCDFCTKFSRVTPNQRSKMGRCRAHGVMVMDSTTMCEAYQLNKDTLEYAKEGAMRL